jgi:hypothetical protein
MTNAQMPFYPRASRRQEKRRHLVILSLHARLLVEDGLNLGKP